MSELIIFDAVQAPTSRKITPDGYLQVDAVIGRTGIQTYFGNEIPGFDLEPSKQYKIYRPAEEVFRPETLASFANKPVTDEHPYDAGGLLDANTTKSRMVGCTHTDVKKDGNKMRASMTIFDAPTINAINDGKTGLSCGYRLKIDMTPGKTPEGESYDGVQRDITGNHVAVCSLDAARGGQECRILDSKKRVFSMSDTQTASENFSELASLMKSMIFKMDSILPHLADKAKKAMDDDQDDKDVTKKKATAKKITEDDEDDEDDDNDPNTMSTDVKRENDRLQGELAALKLQLTDSLKLKDQVSQIVSQRTQLIDSAKQVLVNVDLHAMSDIDIKKAVIKKYDESLSLDSKSIDFIDGFYNCAISNLCDGVGAAYRLGAAIANAQPHATDSNRTALLAEMEATEKARQNINKKEGA